MGANDKQNSILQSIKKLLGLGDGYDVFDQDIIMHINTIFSNMNQMGIGPKEGFMIEDDKSTWDEYIKDQKILLQNIITYVYLKVRLIFDPPANGNLLESINKTANELEYRIYITEGGY